MVERINFMLCIYLTTVLKERRERERERSYKQDQCVSLEQARDTLASDGEKHLILPKAAEASQKQLILHHMGNSFLNLPSSHPISFIGPCTLESSPCVILPEFRGSPGSYKGHWCLSLIPRDSDVLVWSAAWH